MHRSARDFCWQVTADRQGRSRQKPTPDRAGMVDEPVDELRALASIYARRSSAESQEICDNLGALRRGSGSSAYISPSLPVSASRRGSSASPRRPSLLTFPNETLDSICDQCPQSDVANLLVVCRRISPVAKAVLYRHVDLDFQGYKRLGKVALRTFGFLNVLERVRSLRPLVRGISYVRTVAGERWMKQFLGLCESLTGMRCLNLHTHGFAALLQCARMLPNLRFVIAAVAETRKTSIHEWPPSFTVRHFQLQVHSVMYADAFLLLCEAFPNLEALGIGCAQTLIFQREPYLSLVDGGPLARMTKLRHLHFRYSLSRPLMRLLHQSLPKSVVDCLASPSAQAPDIFLDPLFALTRLQMPLCGEEVWESLALALDNEFYPRLLAIHIRKSSLWHSEAGDPLRSSMIRLGFINAHSSSPLTESWQRLPPP